MNKMGKKMGPTQLFCSAHSSLLRVRPWCMLVHSSVCRCWPIEAREMLSCRMLLVAESNWTYSRYSWNWSKWWRQRYQNGPYNTRNGSEYQTGIWRHGREMKRGTRWWKRCIAGWSIDDPTTEKKAMKTKRLSQYHVSSGWSEDPWKQHIIRESS